jgi:hypothetical protein
MNHNAVYEICIEGGPRARWQAWFEGVELLSTKQEDDQPERSWLIVSADDLATLFGLLAQIGALNLRLISVELRANPAR